jgi:hypothetical protein
LVQLEKRQMPDGTNTPRQLSNLTGDLTLTARYTPWGEPGPKYAVLQGDI